MQPVNRTNDGAVPGALNIPVTERHAWMDERPRTVHIVADCHGPSCVLSNDAVAMLDEAGRAAQHLAAGYPE